MRFHSRTRIKVVSRGSSTSKSQSSTGPIFGLSSTQQLKSSAAKGGFGPKRTEIKGRRARCRQLALVLSSLMPTLILSLCPFHCSRRIRIICIITRSIITLPPLPSENLQYDAIQFSNNTPAKEPGRERKSSSRRQFGHHSAVICGSRAWPCLHWGRCARAGSREFDCAGSERALLHHGVRSDQIYPTHYNKSLHLELGAASFLPTDFLARSSRSHFHFITHGQ